ncbi:Serine/threonine-protein kinase PAK 2 [Orobanche hederae]
MLVQRWRRRPRCFSVTYCRRVPIPDKVPRFNMEDYIFVKVVGFGGAGDVSKVKKKSTGEFYAIKNIAIFSDELEDKQHQKNIQHDMSLATSLDHPNVMRCLGVCTNESGIYFLYNYMPQNYRRRCVKDEPELAKMAYQLLKGLDYLRNEKKLVFKHLTPGNIFFDPVSQLYKISDVGIVKDKYITLSYVEVVSSFVRYIAPENYHPMNHLTDLQSDLYGKSDAWSLGLCLLQLYNNGKYPLDPEIAYGYLLSGLYEKEIAVGDDWPPKPPSDASPPFRDFISSCLQLDVSRRYGVDQLLTHPFLLLHGFGTIPPPVLLPILSCEGGEPKMKKTRISNESIIALVNAIRV